jgi:hypothetical protein
VCAGADWLAVPSEGVAIGFVRGVSIGCLAEVLEDTFDEDEEDCPLVSPVTVAVSVAVFVRVRVVVIVLVRVDLEDADAVAEHVDDDPAPASPSASPPVVGVAACTVCEPDPMLTPDDDALVSEGLVIADRVFVRVLVMVLPEQLSSAVTNVEERESVVKTMSSERKGE